MPSSPTVTLASATSNGVDWSTVVDAVAPSVVGIQVIDRQRPGDRLRCAFRAGRPGLLCPHGQLAGGGRLRHPGESGRRAADYKGQVVGSDPMSGLALIAVAVPPLYQDFLSLGSVADLAAGHPGSGGRVPGQRVRLRLFRLGRRRRSRSGPDRRIGDGKPDRRERVVGPSEPGGGRPARRPVRPARRDHGQPRPDQQQRSEPALRRPGRRGLARHPAAALGYPRHPSLARRRSTPRTSPQPSPTSTACPEGRRSVRSRRGARRAAWASGPTTSSRRSTAPPVTSSGTLTQLLFTQAAGPAADRWLRPQRQTGPTGRLPDRAADRRLSGPIHPVTESLGH